MSGIVKYGLLSTAAIGFSAHLPALKSSENSELVAVSSRNIDSARAAATKHSIPNAFGSYQEMIDSDKIDAVINTLPNSMHHEWTIKAMKAGKHVLCEKPLSATMAEAREMAEVAKQQGVVLVEAFTPRWNTQMRTVRRLIAEGEIGDVIRIDSCPGFTATDLNDIRFNKELAGGSMMDVGGYGVYAARFAMSSEPERAAAFQRKRTGIEVDTTFSGLLQFPCGAVANIWCSLEIPSQFPFTAVGTKGAIRLAHAVNEDQSLIIVRNGEEEVIEMQSVNRFQNQIDEFSECVLTGKQPEFPVEDAIHNMAAILALYESADEGRIVDVSGL